jgi:hypothetical protein
LYKLIQSQPVFLRGGTVPRALPLLLLGVFFLVGCEKGDDDKVARAQACLDSATNVTASQCETIVEGVTGAGAAAIRCSVAFITQGFTATRFANAFVALKPQTAGQNATLAMMAYLVFNVGSSNADRITRANTAVSHCTETGLGGMMMFANFAKASTILAAGMSPALTLDSANPPTPAQLQANLASFTGSDADLGSAITGVASIYCGPTSSTNTATFCGPVNSASVSGTPAQVGAAFRALLTP